MNKIQLLIALLFMTAFCQAQAIGHVDKKTREFISIKNPKADYQIFGYEFANNTTRKMICFSTHVADVKDNFNNCPLGAYFDTNELKEGDRIVYLGMVGNFSKMNFISASGKKKLFYLPKSSVSLK